MYFYLQATITIIDNLPNMFCNKKLGCVIFNRIDKRTFYNKKSREFFTGTLTIIFTKTIQYDT